jgi:membrane fusion protein, multidrug efflux system
MRKALVVALVAGIVVAVGGASYWAGSRAERPVAASGASSPGKAAAPGKAAPAGVIVEAVRVQVAQLPQALAAVGSLRSDETVIIRPEVAGRVAQIMFREGERVSKGQVLVKLDDSVQQADLAKARANLSLSKSKFERSADLMTKGFLSSQARDESENSFRVAQAEAELTEARISKMTIRAPFAGTIGLRQVSVGDYVKEGQDLVNLESLDPLKVDFRVPEMALSRVRDGQTLQITLDAIPDKAYDGRVFAINPLIDANGRSIVIRAQVPNKDGRLRPGMFARVRLFTSGVQDTMLVPEESLFPVGDDKYVYKIVDNKATRQKVSIGARRDGRVEILDGLAPEDTVVTAGGIKLREGVAVQVANMPQSAPTARPVLNTVAPKTKG